MSVLSRDFLTTAKLWRFSELYRNVAKLGFTPFLIPQTKDMLQSLIVLIYKHFYLTSKVTECSVVVFLC